MASARRGTCITQVYGDLRNRTSREGRREPSPSRGMRPSTGIALPRMLFLSTELAPLSRVGPYKTSHHSEPGRPSPPVHDHNSHHFLYSPDSIGLAAIRRPRTWRLLSTLVQLLGQGGQPCATAWPAWIGWQPFPLVPKRSFRWKSFIVNKTCCENRLGTSGRHAKSSFANQSQCLAASA
jgi:hypothetical protein